MSIFYEWYNHAVAVANSFFKYINRHLLFMFFTILYLLFAAITYKDYGVTFDEKVEYDAGKFLISYLQNPSTYEYVEGLVNNKPDYIEHRHLAIFSVYSRVYPALVNIMNPNYYFEWFHLQNMLFGYFMFLLSYIFFYFHYKSPVKALTGTLFLVTTPALLGHIPANPKDIPFAIAYLLGVTAIFIFNSRQYNKKLEILIMGIIFGLVVSQRVVGATLPIAYIFLQIKHIETKKLSNYLDLFLDFVLIGFVALLFFVLFLPFLGANLPINFWYILSNAAGYKSWNHEILYFGEIVTKEQRPWHYLFTYLIIKLPLLTLASLGTGTYAVLKKRLKYSTQHPVGLLFFLFFINTFFYLLIHPVVYNGIRHFLFLVLILTLIAGFFFVDLLSLARTHVRKAAIIISLIYSLIVFLRMAHLHPYEYIYFNEAFGGLKPAIENFETEYWGAAYKEGAEYVRDLIRKKSLKNVKVYACDNQFAVVYYSQFEYELLGGSENADIVICDLYKDSQTDYSSRNFNVIKNIEREGVPIFTIRAKNEFIQNYLEK